MMEGEWVSWVGAGAGSISRGKLRIQPSEAERRPGHSKPSFGA